VASLAWSAKLARARGPSGEHLILLARHSDVILEVLLQRAGRPHYGRALRIMEAHEKLKAMLATIESIIDDGAGT